MIGVISEVKKKEIFCLIKKMQQHNLFSVGIIIHAVKPDAVDSEINIQQKPQQNEWHSQKLLHVLQNN